MFTGNWDISLNYLFLVIERTNRVASFSDLQCHTHDQSFEIRQSVRERVNDRD